MAPAEVLDPQSRRTRVRAILEPVDVLAERPVVVGGWVRAGMLQISARTPVVVGELRREREACAAEGRHAGGASGKAPQVKRNAGAVASGPGIGRKVVGTDSTSMMLSRRWRRA